MKKCILGLVCTFLIISLPTFATQVSQQTAQTVALTFFKAHSQYTNSSSIIASLSYTKSEANNSVDFYVFNMGTARGSDVKGFVIVSGYDNLEPVIGYSTESNFDTTAVHKIGVSDWMKRVAVKINAAVSQNVQAGESITNKWTAYAQGQNVATAGARSGSVGPLLATTWNQEPYYNEYCPYNSTDGEYCVTGCVATAMAQIMKYWNYPAQGTGSYSYNDAPPSFSYNYGVQSANFGATTYNWTGMPTSLSADNTAVGTLMYQCGVSVAMDYGDDDEGGSGAYVLQSDAGNGNPCAQNSYATYFSYNASTMQGLYQANYSTSAWVTLMQNELNAGRPFQYEGDDPDAGGHTWVCDGYDNDTMFHMNWGWGGYDNGYFILSNLNPNPYAFTTYDAALIGIEPLTAAVCNVPTGMTTTNIASTSATLSWTAVSGASSYTVEWKATSGSTWTTITGITGTSYSLTGLSAGTAYQWQVLTACPSGSSAYSSSTSFTTTAAPCTAPTGLTTTNIAIISATLSWTAVSGATSYTLQWESIGGTWTTVTGLTSPSYSLIGLNALTAYQWQVETVCSGGTSAYSSATNFTTLALPCSVPAGLTTTNVATTSATLSWGAVSGAVSYTLQWEATGGTWTTVTGLTSASYNLTGLSASTAYQWQVLTVCLTNSSAYSSASNFTTLAPPCTVATGMATSGITDASAGISWTAVSGATSYTLEWKATSGSTWTTITGITSTNYSLIGLGASTAYEWQVETVCSGGTSAYTSATTFSTLALPCTVPSGLTTTNVATTSATLSWGAVSGAVSYTLEWEATGGSWTIVTGLTSASYNLTGLNTSTAYQWQVLTVCATNSSAYSSAASFTTLAPPCTVPSGLTTTNVATTSATLSWGAVSGAVSYTLEWEATGGSWTIVTGLTSASYNLTGLNTSTAYQWQVLTACATNSSAYSSATSFTTLAPPCTVATGMATSGTTDASAGISWTAVSGAISYTLEWKVTSASTWTTVTGITSTNYSLTGLSSSTAYEWQVETVCSGGTSAYTSATTFTTLALPCTVPTGLTTTNLATTSATLSWGAVSGAVSYTLQWEATGGTWTTVTGLTSASYSLTGLSASTAYQWQVLTVCATNSSAYSSATSFTTLAPPCTVPSGLTTTNVATTSATLSWGAVSGAVSYTLEWKATSGSSWTTVTGLTNASYNLTGLNTSTAYQWQVLTVCATNSSAYSSATSFSTLAPPCTVPSGLTTTNVATTSATLSWGAVSGAVSYTLEWEATGGTWTTVTGLTSASYSLTSLNTSTAYQWQVLTVCVTNSSAYSSAASFNTLAPPCTVPTGLTTTNVTTTSATLSWGAVSGAVSYTLEWEATGGSWTTVTGLTSASYSLTGLSASTAYQWQVLTVCATNSSAYSSSASFNTLAPPCTVPTGLTTTNVATTSATLSWGAVSGAVSYTLEWKATSGSTWTTVTGLTSASYSLTGLNTSTAYQWQVLTVCATNNSAYSSATSFTTLAPPCTVPSGLTTTNVATTSATLSWGAVSGAVSYTLQWEATGGSWTTVTGLTSASYSLTGLNTSTAYQWQVSTVCATNSSAYSSAASFTTLAPPCTVPSGLTTTNVATTSATLSWGAVSGAVSYTLQWETTGGTWTTVPGLTSASYSLTGLSASTAYQWQVLTVCATNSSAYSSATSFTTLAPPCTVPSGLTTTNVATTSATLSWGAVSGAVSYMLEWEAVGGTWNTVTGLTSVSYNLAGLTAGTAYKWQVLTVCASGLSAFASAVSFTTLAPPCSVASGMSTSNITDASASISWTAVSGATSYTLEWKSTSAGTWNTVTGIANSSYNLSGLNASTTYQWQVETVCSGGTSAYTSTTTFTTLSLPCTVPAQLATGSITTTTASLSWTSVSGATSYTLEWKAISASTWTTVVGITSTTYNLPGLNAGTAYQWQVETVCSGGNSGYTSATSFTTLAPPCTVPTGTTTGNITDASATISWTAVSGAVSYTLEWKATGGTWTTVIGLTSPSYNLSGLAASTTYQWQVLTVCSTNSSAYSAASSFTTLALPCSVPVGLTTSDITDSTATLSWLAVSGANSYTLQWQETSTSEWTTVEGITGLSYDLSGLNTGTVYQWQVFTVCSAGSSVYSAAIEFTTLAPCGVPTGLSTDSITTGTATLSWTPVPGVTSYTLQWQENSIGTWTTITGLTSASYDLSGLSAGASYQWQVLTVCPSGSSVYSSAASFLTAVVPCGVPAGMTTDSITTTSATLSWTAIPGAASYTLEWEEVSSGNWTSVTGIIGASYDLSGLTAGTAYQWEVITVCASGLSAFTSSVSFTTLASSCSVPTEMTTDSITTTSATLSWTAVSGATSYTLVWQDTSAGDWDTVTDITDASYDLTGLTANTSYEWQVLTVCSGGNSVYSSAADFTTLAPPCSVPDEMTTTNINSTSATLSWNAVSGVTSYTLQWQETSAGTWTTVTGITTASYNLAGLNPSTTYNWQVQTVCSGGVSGFATGAAFTTSAPPCTVPTGLAISGLANTSVTLSWIAVSGGIGYDLQWKLSGDTTWTTVTGLTSNSYDLTGLSTCSAYVFQVEGICSAGIGAYSDSISFSTVGCAVDSAYCASEGRSTMYEYINNVRLGAIDNTSGNDEGYGNFTDLSTPLTTGETYTIYLTPGFTGYAYNEYFTVYIDYDQDGSFSDPGELVAECHGTGPTSATFTVPDSALNGPTRMRIQMQYGTYETNPCTTYGFGQVEDYTVDITGSSEVNPDKPFNDTTLVYGKLSLVKLYPNPAQDNVTVQFNAGNDGNVNMNVYDMLGKRLLNNEAPISTGINTVNMNTSRLDNGVYIYEVENHGQLQRVRFVISR